MTNTKHYNYENFLILYPPPPQLQPQYLPYPPPPHRPDSFYLILNSHPYKYIYCLFNLSHVLYLIKLINQKFEFIVALNAYECLRYHITTEQFRRQMWSSGLK